MRVFVAGASGAIGTRLVPQLVERGHEVVGSSRSPEKAGRLRELGAQPVVLDLLDPGAVRAAVAEARPDAIVHQATALAGLSDFKHFDRSFAPTNRLRTSGTDALLAAARESGVTNVVGQSYAGWPYARDGRAGQERGRSARSDAGRADARDAGGDPASRGQRRRCGRSRASLRRLLRLRGRRAARACAQAALPDRRRRRRRLVVRPSRRCRCCHRARRRTRATGIYNVVDDEPAPVREWLPALAAAIGAKPPRRVPRWLARLAAGEAGVVLMTESRGASNRKAKHELGWTPSRPSWRQGFVEAYRGAT